MLILLGAVLLALAPFHTPATYAASITPGTDATTTTALNLRTGPGTTYAVLLTIPSGSRVFVNSGPHTSVWYNVTYTGQTGYVHGGYLTQSAPRNVLPDLRMAQPREFRIDTSNNQRRLRFTTIIVNDGEGRFEARGSRATTAGQTMSVTQRVYRSDGSAWDRATSAIMKYSGADGHNHWHVQRLEVYELKGISTTHARTSPKVDFCFYDNYVLRSGVPQRYTHCGTRDSLAVRMGLSVGWGDTYSYALANQWVDISNLPNGRYRLTLVADAPNFFLEQNETNNTAWVELELVSPTEFRILRSGGYAVP
jgi:hypothetical protein